MSTNSDKRALDDDSKNESSRSEKIAKTTARKLDFEKTEDDDALPLACSICKQPFLDPIVTKCNHYFCKHCALKHHEKNLNCFVCYKPTLGVFNTAVEIKKNIANVQEKAKAMVKEVSTMVEKAAMLVKNAEAMGAESAEIVEEVETMVGIVEANGADLVANASWDSLIRMVENVEVVAASARDMAEKAAEMVQEANAITEKARADMAKALVVIRNVKWDL
ncbi:unnamed protein product [Microthlaspi erraticum]|uniref:RING-type domain-containing protein n=1 Tax=Microthlaspi erraticum TaxID=1685480 RepID=A0A6D2JKZ7_9BRAS|nr:unnamed protein product [Microthlaspi erraticum]